MAKKITTVTTTTTVTDEPSEKKTYVALVLDASGSMSPVRRDTIGGFNTNVEEIKKNAALGGKTYVSLFTFGEAPNSNPQVKLLNASPEHLEPLTLEQYVPYGNTPLLDALGTALTALQEHDKDGEDAAFLVTVLTDGEENSSREWKGPQLQSLVKALTAKGNWTITLIGANIDVTEIGRKTGIQQAVAYVPTDVGTQTAFRSQGQVTNSYFAARSMGAQSMSNLYNGNAVLDVTAEASLSAKAADDINKATLKKKLQELASKP